MARPLRAEWAGAWHHVTARGNERREIYRDARDRTHFCALLGETVAIFGWRVHAYVLMPNHFHLLVETPEPNLARGMQWLNLSYTAWFNRRHERCGHLFQGRYGSVAVEPETWALELSRYIHLNPVRTSSWQLGKERRQADRTALAPAPDPALVRQRLAALRAYPWSSYRAYSGKGQIPPWLARDWILGNHGGGPGDQAAAYRRFVESALRQGLPERPWEHLLVGTILGGKAFVAKVKRLLKKPAREQPAARCLRRAVWGEIVAAVEAEKKEPWETFRDRHGDWGRDLALHLGRQLGAAKLHELGAAAGGMDYAAVSLALHRFKARLSRDRALQTALQRCQQRLQM